MDSNPHRPLDVDQVERELLSRILDRDYGPGDRLPEPDQLAAELHASVPTVRHAMVRLSTRGLVKQQPGGAAVVLESIHSADFRVLCQIIRRPVKAARGVEVHAHLLELLQHTLVELAQRAALARTDDHVEWLKWHLEVLEERVANDSHVDFVADAHYQLWRVLAGASGNLASTVFLNALREYLSGPETLDLLELPEWAEVLRSLQHRDAITMRRVVEKGLYRKLTRTLELLARLEGQVGATPVMQPVVRWTRPSPDRGATALLAARARSPRPGPSSSR